jgi:hypothetical protein
MPVEAFAEGLSPEGKYWGVIVFHFPLFIFHLSFVIAESAARFRQ